MAGREDLPPLARWGMMLFLIGSGLIVLAAGIFCMYLF